MKETVILGTNRETGSKVSISLPTLIATRCLVQANSGGGKSFLLRRLLEQTHGQVQQIVIDLEGEFHTLREKYDYVLVGKEGDVPINMKAAKLLAIRLLELGVSAILDLSELKFHDRIHYVRLFLESLMTDDKKLWHPVMVVIDEAHLFVPQKGEAESSTAVIDLCTRGRKRSFCAVLATQRLSKLHKDAAAELNNKMIGRTGLDVDIKRASDELGFSSKEDEKKLRDLEAGEFFVFGPAISKSVIPVKVGAVETTHLDATKKKLVGLAPTPPKEKIKAVLGQLADLPKEAEQTEQDVLTLKKQVSELRHQLAIRPVPPSPLVVDEKQYQAMLLKVEQECREEAQKMMQDFASKVRSSCSNIFDQLPPLADAMVNLARMAKSTYSTFEAPVLSKVSRKAVEMNAEVILQREENAIHSIKLSDHATVGMPKKFRAGVIRMLKAAGSYFPEEVSKNRVATLANVSISGGSFSTYLSELKTAGLIEDLGDNVRATQEGMEFVKWDVEDMKNKSAEHLIQMWSRKFRAGVGRMLNVLYEKQDWMSKEDLSIEAKVSGGSFATYLGELRRNGLIEEQKNMVRIHPDLRS